jgi:dTDP-4-dehydrorhamnose 3,5-epimerase
MVENKNDLFSKSLIKIPHPKGGLFKFLDENDPWFDKFGEIYFSTINFQEVKAWKRHAKFTSLITVISGSVRFVLVDVYKKFYQERIDTENNYKMLKIPPGFIYGFQGLGIDKNIVASVINYPHDPNESENIEAEAIEFDWTKQ